MNRLIKNSLVLVALVGAMTAFGTRAEAAFVTGQVDITGSALKDGSAVTIENAQVEGASGDFTALLPHLDPVTHEDFAYNPFPGTGYTPLWEHIASGVSFDLLTLNIDFESSNVLVLSGTGVFHVPGFDDTAAIWNFTMNQFEQQGSFSASSLVPVPEPVSLSLLGLGLAGLAARRRKRA